MEYTLQAGFDRLQQELLVHNYVQLNGSIRRKEVMSLCRLDGMGAYRLLRRLAENGVLKMEGNRGSAYYIPGPNF